MKMQKLALALAVCAVSAGAFAAEDKFYVGGSFGRGAHNISEDDYGSVDDSDTGYKLYGGYRFSKELAIEVNYFDFGEASGKFNIGANVYADKFETSAFGVGVAYSGTIGPDWSLTARLGLASVKTKVARSLLGVKVAGASDDSIKPYVGLGVGYSITPQLSVQGSWDFTQGEVEGEKGGVNLLAIGLAYSF